MRNTIDCGIDLGTTNSALARQEGAATKLVAGPDGKTLLPSAIHVEKDGTIHVGQSARVERDRDPENTAIEFKRLMGTEEKKHFPASGRDLTPEELSAEVLRELGRWMDPNHPLVSAVITIPAMFQLPQCEATRRAAKLAGIEHAPLLQEPIAAAIAHCGTGHVKDGAWLVYDLGGGTFDVSLVRSKAGRLQVLDHDGDNHLGGRDFDRVLTRQFAERIRTEGRLGEFKRSDPANADAFARLKMEVERLRIKLSVEDKAAMHIADLGKDSSGAAVEVHHEMSRAEFEGLIEPLLRRTIQICKKLLARNKLDTLDGLVMVGGPTLTPCVAKLLEEELKSPARHVLDPMTIVACGAALFASTQKLPSTLRHAAAAASGKALVEVQLEYEAMTTDPAPLLVGKLDPAAAASLASARVRREDMGFDSGQVAIGARHAFAVPLKVKPNTLNRFAVELTGKDGRAVAASPSEFSILHGMSVARPPLSQSVGIMLAGNSVCWYLRRGVVLPARHTMTHATTVALKRGGSGDAVNVPMVQGESDRADRNKVIGVLRIHAEKIGRDLPAGTEVEVHLTVDEASHTQAKAFVPLLNQWFDDVVMFRMESKQGEDVSRGLQQQKDRLASLEALADELEKEGDGSGGHVDGQLSEIESLLDEGDRDSIDLADQMVRRMTAEIDRAESTSKSDTLEKEFQELCERATDLLNDHGNESDKRQLSALKDEFWKAMARLDLTLAATKLDGVRSLEMRVLARIPEYWIAIFNSLVQRMEDLGLTDKVARSIDQGRRACVDKSMGVLRQCCGDMIALLPSDDPAKSRVPDIISHLK